MLENAVPVIDVRDRSLKHFSIGVVSPDFRHMLK
jgi:hypothetical protein